MRLEADVEYVVIGLLAVGLLWWLLKRKQSSDDQRSAIMTIAPAPTPAGDRHTFEPERQPAPESGGSCWISPGQTVNVHGLELPGGMLYVGAGLPGANIGRSSVEPALINPALPIDRLQPDYAGHHMDYWPSYAEIPPASRAAYLEWLAHGRPAGAYIGYVFLFFYGIERRVLVDARTSAQARAEIPALLTEVERLLELYAANNSFRRYASDFLATARVFQGITDDALLTSPQERAS